MKATLAGVERMVDLQLPMAASRTPAETAVDKRSGKRHERPRAVLIEEIGDDDARQIRDTPAPASAAAFDHEYVADLGDHDRP